MRSTPITRFMCCIPVEGAVTALGYFQASAVIIRILDILRDIVITVYHFTRFTSNTQYYENYGLDREKELSLVLLILGLFLTLAILLLVGVKKRRPCYVLTYLILGVLQALALAVYWLMMVSTEFYYFLHQGCIEIFLALFVYSLLLTMVYFVYRNIKLEKNSVSMIHNMLQENHCSANDIKKHVV